MPYVRERFFKGGEFLDLADVREQARRWCRDVAGLCIHGTIRRQPLLVFQDEERHTLLPWNGEAYEIADWREAKVHQTITYSAARPCTRCRPVCALRAGR